jgi:uncharacterized membrane protein HdeD (DUF308 family)
VQVVTPLLISIIFTMLAVSTLKKPDWLTVFYCLLAAIGWSIFGLIWPAVTTTDMMLTIGWLWYAIGAIFFVLAFYSSLRLLGAIGRELQKPKLTMESDDSED